MKKYSLTTVLIDIGHPAHVHIFRNLSKLLVDNNYKTIFTVRIKDNVKELLDYYGIEYVSYGRENIGLFQKIFNWIMKLSKLAKIIKKNNPIISISNSSFYLAQISRFNKVYNITLEDTGNIDQVMLYKPFANLILSPSLLNKNLGVKQIKYPGIDELAYLHPKYFTPASSVLTRLNIIQGEIYTIIRFVSHHSSHELYHNDSISDNDKIRIVEQIAKYSKVFISSEIPLPNELVKYKYPLGPETIHDAISFASLVFGESSTMSSEAAILGTPFIFLYPKSIDYTNAFQDQYQLGYNFTGKSFSLDRAIENAVEILDTNNKSIYQQRARKFISESIDVTAFLFWLINEFPNSINQLKTDPKVFEPFYSH
jgi:uncharacterized protein